MKYAINGNDATREDVLKQVDNNYLTKIETIANNLFKCGCFEYEDWISNKLTISITE